MTRDEVKKYVGKGEKGKGGEKKTSRDETREWRNKCKESKKSR